MDDVSKLLDRELWVISAFCAGRSGGLLAAQFSPASINPAEGLWILGLDSWHFTTQLIQRSNAFAAHLLGTDQAALAFNFARDSGKARDKFAGQSCQATADGLPLLNDCVARLECRVVSFEARYGRVYFIAKAARTETLRQEAPLRETTFFASLTEEQRGLLSERKTLEIAKHRPVLNKG